MVSRLLSLALATGFALFLTLWLRLLGSGDWLMVYRLYLGPGSCVFTLAPCSGLALGYLSLALGSVDSLWTIGSFGFGSGDCPGSALVLFLDSLAHVLAQALATGSGA